MQLQVTAHDSLGQWYGYGSTVDETGAGGHRLEEMATRRFFRLMFPEVRTLREPTAGGAPLNSHRNGNCYAIQRCRPTGWPPGSGTLLRCQLLIWMFRFGGSRASDSQRARAEHSADHDVRRADHPARRDSRCDRSIHGVVGGVTV